MAPGDKTATGEPPGDSVPPEIARQLTEGLAEALVTSLSPEARRLRALGLRRSWQDRIREDRGGTLARRAVRVIRRVWAGVINDGTIHAGNFAYMVLISLFPFFITAAALVSALGEAHEREAGLRTVLAAFPADVAETIGPVAREVLAARTGSLLWIGGLVGLWTVGSLVETIRDMLRRAYGTRYARAYWRHRLGATGLILASVVLILGVISSQVALSAAQEALLAHAPGVESWLAGSWLGGIAFSRLAPAPVLFGALWLVFLSLTPSAYRGRRYPKWPAALFVTVWWQTIAIVLPKLLHSLLRYSLTYGSLAGVMIALFFFWLVGLGMVIGAELNAALAETPEERDAVGQADERANAARRAARHTD